MKESFEQPNNSGKEQLPDIDQGEIVIQGVLADYYEKILQLQEDLVKATDEDRKRIEIEIGVLQEQMNRGSNIITEGKTFPKTDNVIEIDEIDKKAA